EVGAVVGGALRDLVVDRRHCRRALSSEKSRRAGAGGSLKERISMFKDLLKQAYNAMQHNRNRTALTMLGMAWGIATVVLLLAYGAGFGRAINNIFSSFGTKIIGVFPGRTSVGAGGQKAGVPIRL